MLLRCTILVLVYCSIVFCSASEDELKCGMPNPLFRPFTTLCPRGLFFPPITNLALVPGHISNWVMLAGRDYVVDGISDADRDRADRLVGSLASKGYVYLVNHSIPEDTIQTAFKQSQLFFNLSLLEKHIFLGIRPPNSKGQENKNRPQNTSQRNPIELRQAWEIVQGAAAVPNASLPYAFPSLLWFMNQSNHVAYEVLQLIAIGLELENVNAFLDVTLGLYNNSVKTRTRLTSAFYTPLGKGQVLPWKAAFVPHHIDFGTVSLIYTTNVAGLQVLDAMGEWAPVDPLPGSIVLIAANKMRIFSGGNIIPVEHRVSPPTVIAQDDGSYMVTKDREQRQSLIHFISSDEGVFLDKL